MTIQKMKIWAILGFALLSAACTATSEVKQIKAQSLAVTPGEAVVLTVVAPPQTEGAQVAGKVRDQLFGKLVSRGKFSQVLAKESPQGKYALKVIIDDVATVSVGVRIIAGVFAGGDELSATVELTDTASGEVQKSFIVKAEAAATWLSSEYGVDSAVGVLTDRIIQNL